MKQLEKKVVVYDIDECLVNSVKSHYLLLLLWMEQHGHTRKPSYAQFCAGGGTKPFEDLWPEYHQYCEENRMSSSFNGSLEEVPGARAAQLTLTTLSYAYLTTRPDDMEQETLEQLKRLEFLQLLLVTRPHAVPISATPDWKRAELQKMARTTQTPKLLLDDNLPTYEAVKDAKDPGIDAILIAGDRTPKVPAAKEWADVPHAIRTYLQKARL